MIETQPLLLDTHAAIWVTHDPALAPKAAEAVSVAYREGRNVLVSAITAWEVGMLVSRNRIRLISSPERWFQRLLGIAGVELAPLSADILIASSFLPDSPSRDPADRILVATAREIGATLVTRDRLLLAYGATGHVSTLAC